MGEDPPLCRFFVSWSGGKDSCLALHKGVKSGGMPALLFTMLDEGGERSHSHGLSCEVLLVQARSLGIPIIFRAASWEKYEAAFLDGLSEIRDADVSMGVFGDIDLDDHRKWVERVCGSMGIAAMEPLWNSPRRDLLSEFITNGFQAMIVAVKDGLLSPNYLGRVLDMQVVQEFESLGIDPSGEAGEYHTVVVDGPPFREPVAICPVSRTFKDGYWFLTVDVCS
ncbi:MAG: diphthine--ammonia ligase [Bacillota bacterium]|nr:diphthine--ammonia ligase [Bacillota bacterium]